MNTTQISASVDFWDGLKLVIGSAKLGYPPILFCGINGCGKTIGLSAVSGLFKHSMIIGDIDHGGLKEAFANGTFKKLKTILLSDAQRFLSRDRDVANKTISTLCQIIDRTEVVDVDYQTFRQASRIKDVKDFHHMNVIVGCTPSHIEQLQDRKQYDFLSRVVRINVHREYTKEDSEHDFRLKWIPPKDFAIPLIKETSFLHSKNPRYDVYKRYMQSIAIAMKLPEFSYQIYDVENLQWRNVKVNAMEKLSDMEKKALV